MFVEPDPYGIPLEVGDAFISLADLTPETEYRVEVLAIGPTSRMSDPTIEMGFMTPADVPPEWPMGATLGMSNLYETGVTCSWGALDPSTDVVRYIVFVDEVEVANLDASQLTHTVRNLRLGESYTVLVLAENRRGLRSTIGLTTSVQTLDVTPPQFAPDGQLEIEAPTVTTIGLSWSAAFDNVGVSSYIESIAMMY